MDYLKTIRVLVGAEEKEYIIPEYLLTSTSAFFKVAGSQKWKEGQDRTVRLPEQDLELWTAYLHWKFTHSLTASKGSGSSKKSETKVDGWQRVILLWITADQLQDLHLQNKAADQILAYLKDRKDIAGPDNVSIAWASSVPESSLRRLLIDGYVDSDVALDSA